jgi:hypothetical protein
VPSWPTQPAGRTSAGTARIVIGAVLIVFSMIGTATHNLEQASSKREIALPGTAVGLARNAQASATAQQQLANSLPAELQEPQAAVYGEPPTAVLVVAGKEQSDDPASGLEGFRRGIASSGTEVTSGRDVDPGSLGGAARCYDGRLAGAPVVVCAFVDKGSFLATYDFLGGTIDDAAQRGRQIRDASVHKA